jgi:hypothetical protein
MVFRGNSHLIILYAAGSYAHLNLLPFQRYSGLSRCQSSQCNPYECSITETWLPRLILPFKEPGREENHPAWFFMRAALHESDIRLLNPLQLL